jgi:acetyl esterase/lipase
MMPRIVLSLHLVTWLVLTAVTAWVWTAADRAFRRAEVRSPVVVREDVVYRTIGGHRLSLDVYQPPDGVYPAGAGTRRPAILAIHGGSWIGGSKRLFRPSPWNPQPTAVRLAEEGYLVIAADYRLARPGSPTWPDALDDLREAVRWTRRYAGDLGIDPDRIAVLGQSAGAHLAALLGISPDPADDLSHVQAVVDFYGPTDLERLPLTRSQRLAHDPVFLFLGRDPPDFSVRARDASPIHRVRSDSAPMLLFHGTRDAWVPIEQSEELARALRDAGVTHRLMRIEGAQHGFDAEVRDPEVTDPDHRDLLDEILDFLRSVWNAQSR